MARAAVGLRACPPQRVICEDSDKPSSGQGGHPGDHVGAHLCAGFCRTSPWCLSKQTHLGVFNQTLTFDFIQ